MPTKLTQSLVNAAKEKYPPGTQVYDADVSGLRMVVGKSSASFKLVGRINDSTGRYISVILGRTDEVSLRTARDRSAELRLALRRGIDPRRPKTSVPNLDEALERYLTARGDELSPKTVVWYQEKVKGPLSSLRKLPLDRVDREQVRALHEKITKDNGAYTANGAMRVLKMLFNDVARTHDLPPNPVTRAVRMNKETARDWAVSPEAMPELWQDLDQMEDRVRRCCWVTMLLTSLRSNDARSMRWDHIDDDGVLTVPSPKGGAGKAFKFPLPNFLMQQLGEVKELLAPLESPFVFASPTSTSGHIEQLRRTQEFDHAPHEMRHTWRTMALEAGVDLSMTMVLMNHRIGGVSGGYVTRANLLGPMRDAAETVCKKIVSYRGVR